MSWPRAAAAAAAAAARHEVYLLKLISFELSTGNNAKIIHRHHQYNQPPPFGSTGLTLCPDPWPKTELFASLCCFVNLAYGLCFGV